LLQSKEKFSAADFKAFQNDYYSQFAKDLVPFILHSYAGDSVRDERIVTMLRYFRNWNFMMTKDDVPTAIFEVFFNHLMKNIFHDEMGDELYRQYIFLANIPYRVVPALLNDTSSVWFDDVTTPSVETKNDIIHKSMDEALEELTGRFGSEMKEWQWGKLHTLTLRHPFSNVSVLRSVFTIGPFEMGGSGTTVNNGEYHLGEPYEMTLGPSTRQIVDFADINKSLSVIPSGQSGQPFHDHFSDQSAIWRNGEYHELPLDDRFVAERSKNILYLIPEHQ
jgi:penicillin amidase